MEEKSIKQTIANKEKEIYDKITKHALVIQSIWRGYRLRKGLYKKTKKKKK
jgi:hypothetical protein